MKHIIIDAFNLIHYDRELKSALLQSIEKASNLFVEYVNSYAIANPKVRITVVFDGRLGETYSSLENVYLEESGQRIADDLIKEYIDNSVNPKFITVVSSDREILDYARLHYSNFYRAEEFWLELKMLADNELEIEEVKKYNRANLNKEDFKPENNYLKYFEENPLDDEFMSGSFLTGASANEIKKKSLANTNSNSKKKEIISNSKANNKFGKKASEKSESTLELDQFLNHFDKNTSEASEQQLSKRQAKKQARQSQSQKIDNNNTDEKSQSEDGFDDFMQMFS